MERGNGVLLHISSLPSKHGIGTFGKEAYAFVRFLKQAGQKYWQVLPLNPTSYGDSPYQSFSAFALNPYFIDLELLVKKGYLTKEEVRPIRGGQSRDHVDYGRIYEERFAILRLAYHRAYDQEKELLEKYLKKNKAWLVDYADFMLTKDMFGGVSWLEWPRDYKFHRPSIIKENRAQHQEDFWFWVFLQYHAFMQYRKLKRYANSKGIHIIGDMPIYVAADSADVWANPRLFLLDKRRNPALVAGVPPDYFSETGQLWGNPIYDWQRMRQTGYRWWKRRVKQMSKLYDCLRIDHFRGFESFWAVAYGQPTAMVGEWLKGPDHEIIDAFREAAPKLQIIAEDLGVITDQVRALLSYSGYPGLKVFEFAFGGEVNDPFLPHTYPQNCVAYIGTHDNDVLANFLIENPDVKRSMQRYLNCDDNHDHLIEGSIRRLMESAADVTIFMMQDLLHLGKESRMNIPGTAAGNWQFRIRKEMLSKELAKSMYLAAGETGRL